MAVKKDEAEKATKKELSDKAAAAKAAVQEFQEKKKAASEFEEAELNAKEIQRQRDEKAQKVPTPNPRASVRPPMRYD
jgi:hypothetical protein